MEENKKQENLIDFLNKHRDRGEVSFHMPGHKGMEFYESLGYGDLIRNLVSFDITEIYGADNLFQAEGVILRLMERYKELYGSGHSFLSVGGSSNGLMASIMSVCNPGDVILIARNCHKSVYNGVSLAGGAAEYVYPEIVDGYGFAGEVSPEGVKRAIEACNPDNMPKALVITSPNYYGIIADVASIAKVCHDRGIALIVDQAHGAHLAFETSMPSLAAERLGADIVVNSIHKTLASFTQTAVVNVMSDMIDTDILAEKLEILQSSSPSYILMASLDLNAEIMETQGPELMTAWKKNLDWFYGEANSIEGLRLFESENHDRSKILLDMTGKGISGFQLEALLREDGILVELSDAKVAMAMTGIGNKAEDYRKLWNILQKIAKMTEHSSKKDLCSKIPIDSSKDYDQSCHTKTSELTDNCHKRAKVFYTEAIGQIAAAAIIPYPPGIPLLVPGEVVTKEIMEEVIALRQSGQKVLGIDNSGMISIKLQ